MISSSVRTLVLLVGIALPVATAVASDPASTAPLRVAVSGSEPFVVSSNGEPTGLAVEVWRAVAALIGRPFALTVAPSPAAALEAVASGNADIAVGPLSITAERCSTVACTQPYFTAAIGILAPHAPRAIDRLRPFLTTAFLSGLGALIVTLFLVGLVMWIAERRANPDIPRQFLPGVSEGVWMALVTMTTVGYGDRVPRTWLGRIVTGTWMLVSLVVTSSLVAFIASAITLSQIDAVGIDSLQSLRGKRAAIVDGAASLALVAAHGVRPIVRADLNGCFAAVAAGDADAIVHDRPVLRYHLLQHPELPLSLASTTYLPHGYGFAVQQPGALERSISVAILELQESGELQQLTAQWLGP